MNQEALGKMLGDLPRQHISSMENNSRTISLEMARKLAKQQHHQKKIVQTDPELLRLSGAAIGNTLPGPEA